MCYVGLTKVLWFQDLKCFMLWIPTSIHTEEYKNTSWKTNGLVMIYVQYLDFTSVFEKGENLLMTTEILKQVFHNLLCIWFIWLN